MDPGKESPQGVILPVCIYIFGDRIATEICDKPDLWQQSPEKCSDFDSATPSV
jgi:hypothetical protein